MRHPASPPNSQPKTTDAVFVAIGRAPAAAVRCPRCGAEQTDLISAFGPAPCQELRRCATCREPFPAIKQAR